jgi:hypothetical protein
MSICSPHPEKAIICIEHAVTADMADGQPLPPLIEDGVVWRVVRHVDGHTLWRRLFIKPFLVTEWRPASGDQTTRLKGVKRWI